MLQKFNRLLALAAALFAGIGLYAENPVAQEPQRRTAAPTVGGDQNAIIERAVRRRTMMEARKAAAERNRPAREAALAAARAKVKAAVKATGSVPYYKAPKEGALAPADYGTMDPQGLPHYMDGVIPNYANTDPLPKFVHTLPGLGDGQPNDLGNYIPVGVPDRTTYPGSDYYSIDLIDYTQQLHGDLPKATKLRGYIQHGLPGVNTVTGGASNYLGPVIVAKRDRPVRVKFTNLLGIGDAGNLPLPMDSSLMGSGAGPGGTTFTQNRAELHLHGGLNPWISDGTPHQWFTPAGDPTANKKGVSFRNVPDMINVDGVTDQPGDGIGTYFYTNQQSGRFMFYHDHSFGLTRLNVYMGEAAGYMIVDPVETKLINAEILPSQGANLPITDDPWDATPGVNSLASGNSVYTYGIPLVFQDKTFVPNEATSLVFQDPTWDLANWGAEGDLWFPHVYMPNQNPDDPSGANAMGRWDYGPWFWPPLPVATTPITPANTIPMGHGPIPGSGIDTDGNGGFSYPGTPNPSLTPEAFMDTPVVNGTPYPTITVQPQAYRFRMLNAANDRPFSFAFYTAKDGFPTEVNMIDASPANAVFAEAFFQNKYGLLDQNLPVWPKDGRAGGVVDFNTIGPDIIQIGNESGFLPAPVVFRSQPTTYNYNRRDIVVLDVEKHALWLTPAERADVIVDFSAFRGKTLILYNDMLAPVPAFDVRYDYYTGPDADQTATGGALDAQPGFGPNTRTLMQFKVADVAPAAAFDLAALEAAFASTATTDGSFKASQHPPIIPQKLYNSAMNTAYTTNTYGRIQDNSKTYARTENGDVVTVPFQPKAIQELFELDYGRMNATLGVELPFTNFNNQTTIPIGYSELPTEFVTDGSTQIWKITHNGVDTHPVHFHLFDVQIMNRVGWDGAVRFPEDNELGWKETVRMKPLEDIIVAFRPRSPRLPFSLAGITSQRVLDPTKDATASVPTTDIAAGALNQGNLGNIVLVSNSNSATLGQAGPGYDYGWEYVWHCHILGHEENDFMRPLVLNVATSVPAAPTSLVATAPVAGQVNLTWTDNATNEVSYLVQRKTGIGGTFATLAELVPDVRSYTDITATLGFVYFYRVIGWNQAGNSASSNVVSSGGVTISGFVYTPGNPAIYRSGVTLTFSGQGDVVTDANGFYTAAVPSGWSGTVTPSGGTFVYAPVSKTYTTVSTDQTGQNIWAYTSHTISGTITAGGNGVAGITVAFSNGGPTVTTIANGTYTAIVPHNWSGTVTPSSVNYTFTPVNRTYASVIADQTAQNYTAVVKRIISGYVYTPGNPATYRSGITLTFSGLGTTTTDGSGFYTLSVPSGWTGTVVASAAGFVFAPASKSYTNVTTSQVNQNIWAYPTFAITGTITTGGNPLAGVVVNFSNSGGSATTNASGVYTVNVQSGWSGTAIPVLSGYTFAAASTVYTNVLANQVAQDYLATPAVTISGLVYTPGNPAVYRSGVTITVSGVGSTTTNAAGFYTIAVPSGWTGTVVASAANFIFAPATKSYTNLTVAQANQNIWAYRSVTVAGFVRTAASVPVAGVTISFTNVANGLGTTTTLADGSYVLSVQSGWSGTVTPTKTGSTFTPVSTNFTNVTTNRAGINFTAN